MRPFIKAMESELISTLAQLLLKGKIQDAVDVVVPWLRRSGATVGAVSGLLAVCPSMVRPRLVALLADVLTGYPQHTLAVPVVLHAEPEDRGEGTTSFFLPVGGREPEEPEVGIRFIGWAPITTILPEVWVCSRQRRVAVETHRICAVVALFASQLAPDDLLPVIGPEWWADVFLRPGYCLAVATSGGQLFPYPAAVEAAKITLEASEGNENLVCSGSGFYDPAHFLDVADQIEAIRRGRAFRQSLGRSVR